MSNFQKALFKIRTFGVSRVLVDVDGVLLNSRIDLLIFAKEILPSLRISLDPEAPSGCDFLGIPKKLYLEILNDKRQVARRKPLIVGARKGLAFLNSLGFQVDLLSSIEPEMVETRLRHLREDGLQFGELLSVPYGETKEHYLRTFSPAIMIDDYPKQIVAARAASCLGVIFDQRYNRSFVAPRLLGWSKEALVRMFFDLASALPEGPAFRGASVVAKGGPAGPR